MSNAITARTPFTNPAGPHRVDTDRLFTGPGRARRDEAASMGASLLQAAKDNSAAAAGSKVQAARTRLAALRQAAQMAAAAGDPRTARNIAAQAARLAREAKGSDAPSAELDHARSEMVAEARAVIAAARRAAKPGSKEDIDMEREANGLDGASRRGGRSVDLTA
jgi:hypothetical protein